MGMAASQVRLLQLTSRKNDIGYQLENLSLQKTSLSRDMQRVSKNYQSALNTKTLKWSNNSGVSYVDLSYANLMRPSNANQNTPYLLTNANGKVIVDSKYEKYAEMISADGSSGGDWETNRTKILSQLTGISEEKIESANSTSSALSTAATTVNKLKEEEPEEPINKETTSNFVSHMGSVTVDTESYDISSLYSNSSGWTSLGSDGTVACNKLTNILNGIADNMKKWLTEDDYTKFKAACDTFMKDNGTSFTDDSTATQQGNDAGINGIRNGFEVNMKQIIDSILGSYKSQLSEGTSYEISDSGYSGDTTRYYTRDTESDKYKTWQTNYKEWETSYNEAVAAYNSAVDTDNQVMTADEESSIDFYDQLFTAIAEKGWAMDSQIEDNDYLNNMLQNNQYYITTMDLETDDEGKEYYEYEDSIASNFDNIFSVNDTDAQNEALVEYEYEKSIINEKESRIDTRMQNLETEQSAINEMIKGIEEVRNNNIEKNFGIFA